MLSMSGIEKRFLTRVLKTNDCWLWTGGCIPNGYGAFWFDGRNHGAHRMAWLIWRGDIPKGMSICHKCDNPICVNPGHLFVGLPIENSADMVAKNRQARGDKSPRRLHADSYEALVGSNNNKAKLTEDQIPEIKRLVASGLSMSEVGRRFGVGNATISKAVAGHTWKHVN